MQHPGLADRLVSLMVGFAPVTATANMFSPIRLIAPVADQVERVLSMTGNSEFGAQDSLMAGNTKW